MQRLIAQAKAHGWDLDDVAAVAVVLLLLGILVRGWFV